MTFTGPKVVIVGAGFGGLAAAKELARAPVAVTVLDRENHHCFQPLLYQVASAAVSPADIAWPVRGILRRQQNTTVLMAEATAVDLDGRSVTAGGRTFPYDHLVIATGATHSYFGHDEWGAWAPGLKRIEDATRIRRKILMAFEQAELSDDPAERRRLLTFVIVGGGPTGVEMAGAIAEIARQALVRDFRRIDPSTAQVVLIEAGPRILPTFPEDLSAYARAALIRMGVDVRTGTSVTNCRPDGVDIADGGAIAASTTIWAAGVVASPAAAWLGVPRDRAGRVLVSPDLSIPGRPEVFVIGDTASVADREGHPVPGIAPAAKQMGIHVARTIAASAAKSPPPGPFVYRHQGNLATIGRKAAIVDVKGVHLKGFVGWMFWGAVHIYFLIGLRNRFIVAFTLLWNYLTLQRSARLITDSRAEVDGPRTSSRAAGRSLKRIA